MHPTKFQVNWPFISGEEAKNRLSRWPSRRPSFISDRNDFRYFLSAGHLNASYQGSSPLAFWVWRRSKNRFLRWPIGTILAFFFYLQVSLMLATKFQVNWPFVFGEEIHFQDGRHGSHFDF